MSKTEGRKAIYLAPNAGRRYAMGPLQAIFKADGSESGGSYAVSEWWLAPRTKGPGAHSHPDDDLFFVLAGTISFRIGKRWVDAPKGSFVLAPGGVLHDFENRGPRRAGLLNISVPGGFEENMPPIAEWFRKRSPEDSRTTKPLAVPSGPQTRRSVASASRAKTTPVQSSARTKQRKA